MLWVLHSCCESCLSRMGKRRQSDVILQEQGLFNDLCTVMSCLIVFLKFRGGLGDCYIYAGSFSTTWPHKPCFSCDMRMRKKVLFEHAPPLQRQQGTLRRPINLGNTTMLLWWLCLVLASQVDGCSGSWPQGGLPEEPPECFKVLVGGLGSVALAVHHRPPSLREPGVWLVAAFAVSRLLGQETRLGQGL